MDACSRWLFSFLQANGITHCDIVREKAFEAGFSRKELKAARKAIGVQCWNDFVVNGETLNWFWYLPDDGRGKNA